MGWNDADQNRVVCVGGFDEGAAQVRRLLDRDRKDVDFDELEKSFESKEGESVKDNSRGIIEATPSNSGALFSADKTKMSPFGPTSTASNPFESTPTKRSPLEPKGLSPSMEAVPVDSTPWWKKITLTQVVIVLSFTTIISLMIATFFVVLNMGGIRLNE